MKTAEKLCLGFGCWGRRGILQKSLAEHLIIKNACLKFPLRQAFLFTKFSDDLNLPVRPSNLLYSFYAQSPIRRGWNLLYRSS